MADGITILVGTAGQGVMRSTDGGDSWRRVGITQGIHSDAVVRCLTPVPGTASSVLAGCDKGIIRSDDNGDTWHAVSTPMDGTAVWAIAFDPSNPQVGFAGTGTPNPCQIIPHQGWRSLLGAPSLRSGRRVPRRGCAAGYRNRHRPHQRQQRVGRHRGGRPAP